MNKPKLGFVYYLKDYTAPKVFDGDRFLCLLTEQVIDVSAKISVDTKTHIKDWVFEISGKERFTFLSEKWYCISARSRLSGYTEQFAGPFLKEYAESWEPTRYDKRTHKYFRISKHPFKRHKK